MTLAHVLAQYGVASTLVERNETTTLHPKMDITNGRSMELFRRLGLADRLRAAAVPEENNFDISWITSLAKEAGGRELHRFRYPSVVEKRAEIRARNDGTQPREPAMRVSSGNAAAESTFICGVPMNCATNWLAGWSYSSSGEPTCSIRPSRSTTTRSASVIAST